jgi:hypothetical protein
MYPVPKYTCTHARTANAPHPLPLPFRPHLTTPSVLHTPPSLEKRPAKRTPFHTSPSRGGAPSGDHRRRPGSTHGGAWAVCSCADADRVAAAWLLTVEMRRWDDTVRLMIPRRRNCGYLPLVAACDGEERGDGVRACGRVGTRWVLGTGVNSLPD